MPAIWGNSFRLKLIYYTILHIFIFFPFEFFKSSFDPTILMFGIVACSLFSGVKAHSPFHCRHSPNRWALLFVSLSPYYRFSIWKVKCFLLEIFNSISLFFFFYKCKKFSHNHLMLFSLVHTFIILFAWFPWKINMGGGRDQSKKGRRIWLRYG